MRWSGARSDHVTRANHAQPKEQRWLVASILNAPFVLATSLPVTRVVLMQPVVLQPLQLLASHVVSRSLEPGLRHAAECTTPARTHLSTRRQR